MRFLKILGFWTLSWAFIFLAFAAAGGQVHIFLLPFEFMITVSIYTISYLTARSAYNSPKLLKAINRTIFAATFIIVQMFAVTLVLDKTPGPLMSISLTERLFATVCHVSTIFLAIELALLIETRNKTKPIHTDERAAS